MNNNDEERDMADKALLESAEFGSRIAEDEVDELHSYFVETDQWRRILSGEVDIIFGAKGAGKSALYSLLVAQKDKLRLGARTLFISAENPRGTPVFRDLTTSPSLSEESFRGLWKLYFLSISANYIRTHLTATSQRNADAESVINMLSLNGLCAPNVTLLTRLKSVLEYIRRHVPTFEGGVIDPNTGLKITGKITFSEPTAEQRSLGYQSLDDLFDHLNNAFSHFRITVWLALDRLDVAFSDSDTLERNALRALFRTYLDMSSLTHIKVKIFLRDDIWRKIVNGGFREASHIIRTTTIAWDQQSLMNLLVRRIASNAEICSRAGLSKAEILSTAKSQESFFYRIFPAQVDAGQRQPKSLDWMLSRTADGTGRTAPRELIHLLLAAKEEQLKLYHLGNASPDGDLLFSKQAIRAALPVVSKARYDQTLCAEYPSLKPYLDKLEREKTQQSRESLASLWNCPVEDSSNIAEKLVEAGFFERRGTKETPIYWIPFLYRDALNLVQGAA
ncbi:hypothetical protein [Janthinobacterium sp. JC611]|uniref:P-loop ATPase, Sll1717 family n=1 Tax=Janthinobacterium sp. JC611 TaxID=2816201 RepID=UPI001BFDA6F2|nr:hypothetical protein [Janthinobacterium sp. JC611]